MPKRGFKIEVKVGDSKWAAWVETEESLHALEIRVGRIVGVDPGRVPRHKITPRQQLPPNEIPPFAMSLAAWESLARQKFKK